MNCQTMDAAEAEPIDGDAVPVLGTSCHFGFVTARAFDGLGYCGGYLILNGYGHPCEFHCSLPISPNQTQKILYGSRLDQFLIGHTIVPALLEKASIAPTIILANDVSAVSLAATQRYPLALVLPKQDQRSNRESKLPTIESQPSHAELPLPFGDWICKLINDEFSLVSATEMDTNIIELFVAQFCIQEPFQRIQEALAEAQTAVAAA